MIEIERPCSICGEHTRTRSDDDSPPRCRGCIADDAPRAIVVSVSWFRRVIATVRGFVRPHAPRCTRCDRVVDEWRHLARYPDKMNTCGGPMPPEFGGGCWGHEYRIG